MNKKKSWTRIQILVPNDLLAKIKSAAKKDNRSLGGWIKNIVIEYLKIK